MTAAPEFDRPPVAEVSLAVQFDDLHGLSSVRVGQLFALWSARYPQHEEHEPLAPMPDEATESVFDGVLVRLIDRVPLARTWFMDARAEHLVQVQRDRFSLNWQRGAGDYPHYGSLRPIFEQEFAEFAGFMGEFGPPPAINQWQVAYINPIPLAGEMGCPDGIAGLLFGWSGGVSGQTPLPSADVRIQMRFPIDDRSQTRVGWLYVDSRTALNNETGEKVVLLELTARGRPADSSASAALDGFDLGHSAIISTFAAITRPEMHQVWKRTS